MASKQKYECFTCRDNGFPNVLVYLAGKDSHGKAIRVEEDGSTHVHKTKQEDAPKLEKISNLPTGSTHQEQQHSMKIINAKLDRIIELLESQKQK